MLDITGFDAIDTKQGAAAGRWMTILNLNGTPLLNAKKGEQGLLLVGSDSDVFREAERVSVKERFDQAAADEESGHKPSDAEQARRANERAMRHLAACIIGWRGILDSKGKEVDFKPEGALQIVSAYPVLRDQADRFITTRANFTKASSAA